MRIVASKFETYHLRITMTAQTPIQLGQQKGSALRGALVNTLRRHYFAAPDASGGEAGPLGRLVMAEDPANNRGRDLPRAYVINPPLDGHTRYDPGDNLTFGLGLFGSAANLYTYLITALPMMGQEGLGHRLPENKGERGRLSLVCIEAENPLTRERTDLLSSDQRHVSAAPTLPVNHELIVKEARRWPSDRVTIRFLTPTRITMGGRLVHQPDFLPLFQRLIERIISLWKAYGEGVPPFGPDRLLKQADPVNMLADNTSWIDYVSRSSRSGRKMPMGGFAGTATYTGDLHALLPWLLWGQCVHVGKNAVKGSGWYELLP
jgi:hypothetical protein